MRQLSLALVVILASALPAGAQYAQIQAVEVAPFVGVRFGGSFDTQIDGPGFVPARLDDARGVGFSAGVRFDDLSLVEFRWTQSTSAIRLDVPLGLVGRSVGELTLNQFHADFTREWELREVRGLRSFLTGSLGITHIGAADEGFTRFSFGFGTGLKQFIGSRLAIRAEAQWLPVWIEPSVGFACGAIQFGGCFVVLSGELVQQFQLAIGPVLRF